MPKIDQDTKQKRKDLVYECVLRHDAGITEKEIDELLALGRRNVNNYLRELEIEGKVERQGHVWIGYLYRRTTLRRFEISPEEAMTLYLATRLLVKQHDKRNESAQTALVKLAEVLTGDVGVGYEIHQAALELAHRPGDESYSRIFRAVMQGYIYRRKLAITYEPLGGTAFETVLSPYLLEPSAIGYATYVIGHSSVVNALRTYKLERIRAAALTREEYRVPADFPGLEYLRSAWSIISGEETVQVKVRFAPGVAAQRVRESYWHPSQQIVDDPEHPGGCFWSAQVADVLDFKPWLRSWGGDVEVLEPPALREELRREVRKMARVYGVGNTPKNPHEERLLQCWGKTGKRAEHFHPALFHLLDVGYVAQTLLREPASARWRQVLARALNAEAESLYAWLPYFIALHDLGKISPPFQSARTAQKTRLEQQGFRFGDCGDHHHSSLGQVCFLEIADEWGLPETLRDAIAEMIGSHHGRFSGNDPVKSARHYLKTYEPAEWRELRATAVSTLKPQLLLNPPPQWPAPTNISAAIMALTGFTILCDWLGSDGKHFAPRPDTSVEDYLPDSQQQAQAAVAAAGFFAASVSSAPTRFAELCPDKQPARPLQMAIDDVPADLLTGPCLAILEAPTGEGKTEAALALAHRIAQARGSDELYYALPTTATSNQMFIRLQTHLRDRLGLETQVKLIHGQAFLVEDDLRPEPLDDATDDHQEAALEWFGPKKRALLAPFGVGTIDQAELATLNVKHTALRMIGLAGKVVILDEVHAYDTYMTTIIESLLQWLRALDASVILLSATLPQARRTALARAYGVKTGDAVAAQDYPALWVFGDGEPYHAEPAAMQPERVLALDWLRWSDEEAEAKAHWLIEQSAAGGCVCWMTNTVRCAQEIFAAVDRLADPEIDRMLLHAQLPLCERERRETALREKYGPPDDKTQRPARGIIIGTQVLEQSLDLDFDALVSDLAPVDLLLQRAGRLHRHTRARPAAHATPHLWINAPLTAENRPSLDPDRWVYAPFLLLQTWATLADRAEIILPRDYRLLVEAVYGISPAADHPFFAEWQHLGRKEKDAVGEANIRLLPEPDPEWAFSSRMSRLTFEESETSAAWIVGKTRLGAESVTVIPLERRDNVAWGWAGGPQVALNQPAPRDVQLELLRRQLRISHHEAVPVLKAQKLPALFTRSTLLKDCFPLWLTDGMAELPLQKGVLEVHLDDKLGLQIRKKGA